jgi:hypothetical protein
MDDNWMIVILRMDEKMMHEMQEKKMKFWWVNFPSMKRTGKLMNAKAEDGG